jgi:hypothetical protein
VRHVNDQDLDELEPLLGSIRAFGVLKEKKRGTFYRGQKAFLHFHADPSGVYADLRTDPTVDFERRRVTTKAERDALLRSIRRAVAER